MNSRAESFTCSTAPLPLKRNSHRRLGQISRLITTTELAGLQRHNKRKTRWSNRDI